MMDWVNCSECILLKEEDCIESRRSDGCYFGLREEDLDEKDSQK